MNPVGIAISAEFIDCRNKELLIDSEKLTGIMEMAIKSAGMTCVLVKSIKTPPGLSMFALLTESHVAIHIYPEACHASIDVFTCSKDRKKPEKIINVLKEFLNPTIMRKATDFRGNSIERIEENRITAHSTHGFQVSYQIDKIVHREQTDYQEIKIIDNPNFGRMLFLDNDLQVTSSDAFIYDEAMIDPISTLIRNSRVAILGGGDGGILREVLEYGPMAVYLVDIDYKVIEASKNLLQSIHRDAFSDSRANIVNDDANNFLETNQKDFDVIVYDLTMHPESLTHMDREKFIDDIFYEIADNLREGGVVTLQCCSKHDSETYILVKSILEKNFKDIVPRSKFIPSFCESWIFISAVVK